MSFDKQTVKVLAKVLAVCAVTAVGVGAYAAGADLGQTTKQATNWTAIGMFAIFVAITLFITKWAAAKTKSAADFYTAGGGITGFQNGLAIAGDYMSAASFLGISGLVFANGFDGLIFSIGWLVGWPVITFLMAERLRNLGKFTFADVAGYRFSQTPIRIFAASGSLVVVAFYMIAQMVGAGQLIKLLFGMDYLYAEILVGSIMMIYVLFGGMTATTWVQIIKACMLLGGATFMALAVLIQFGFSPEAMFTKAVEVHSKKDAIMGPGALIKDPISAISVGMALMFGTAGLPHILMRFFTVPNAKEARKSVGWATTWIGYFYILTFIIGFGAITNLIPNPANYFVGGEICQGPGRRRQHGGGAPGRRGGRQLVPGLHLGGGLRHHPGGGGRPDAVGRLGGVARPLRLGLAPWPCRPGPGTARLQDHHGVPGHRRRGAGHRLREGKRRLHGDAGLRDRRPRPTSRCCSCRCCGRAARPRAR